MPSTPTRPCTCAALRRLTRQVSTVYDHHLAPAGLKTSQYSLLMHLDADGVGLTTLARRTGTDRTTLTRNLAVLERAGWVAIGRADDARQRLIRLTEAGAAKRRATYPYWRQAQDLIEATLSEASVTALHAGIDAALKRLRPLIPAN